ncbi:MAG: carbohydrate ABC transporter permease [Chloroflexi bacterium]|nr:carbohydrate ABC transporter permease [Chloroflexota bacterium]
MTTRATRAPRVRPERPAPTLRERLFGGGAAGEPSRFERALYHLVLIASCIVLVGPFLMVISASLKESGQLFEYPPRWLPFPPYLGQYEKLLTDSAFPRWMFNTLFVGTIVTVAKVFLDSMAGYAFAKLHFVGRNVFFLLMIAMLLVPYGAIILPLYTVSHALGIHDTYLALILPPLCNPLGVFLMRQVISMLPRDLENAARLDGVSEFGIYRRIVLPLIKPSLVVLAIITFTDMYMSFIWPLVAVRDTDLQVLTVGVASMRNMTSVNFSLWSAAAVLGMVPLALAFFLFQRQFQARSIAGALKQ